MVDSLTTAEDKLKFSFVYTESQTNRALQQIAREFPDLSAEDIDSVRLLMRLAENLLTDSSTLANIPDFSLTFGAELEATIIINGVPFDDYVQINGQKITEFLDRLIEIYALEENLRKPGFFATDFDSITGWNTDNVSTEKAIASQQVSTLLNVPLNQLSFNEIERAVLSPANNFSTTSIQAINIYRYIIISYVTQVVFTNIRQILEEVLISSGTSIFSDIATRLGDHLNINNRKTLQLAVEAEQSVIKKVLTAAQNFGAIFPQLRQA